MASGHLIAKVQYWAASRRTRLWLIALGVAVAAVPTFFTVFPSWGIEWPLAARVLIVAVWLGVALWVVYGGVRQAEQLAQLHSKLTEDENLARQADRLETLAIVLRSLLDQPPGFPMPGHLLAVYVLDWDAWCLKVVASTGGEEADRTWDIGRGATGTAWARRKRVVAVGKAVWNEKFDLTTEEGDHFRDLKVVVAYPIRTQTERMVGVLTAWSKEDSAFLTSAAGEEAVEALAAVSARLLVDLQGESD